MSEKPDPSVPVDATVSLGDSDVTRTLGDGSSGASKSMGPSGVEGTPGREFGTVRITREIGRGAMGVVYLGHDRVLGRQGAGAVGLDDAAGPPGFPRRSRREPHRGGGLTMEHIRVERDGAVGILVIDRREHFAGNAYDYYDEHGVLVHRYGPHIFHTNSDKVVDYLSQFTEWRPYEHRVVARVNDDLLVPMPINRTTINELYGLDLQSDEEVEAFYAERREPVELMKTSEDAVVAKVGRELYELFFRGYTRKQWQRDPSELHASVCARIPIRTNTDDRYFNDTFQEMPAEGYTRMFERMLDHPNIEIRLETEFDDVRDEVSYGHLVYTGPIDAFFDHRFGKLPYRSLEFELRSVETPGGTLPNPTSPQLTPVRRVEPGHVLPTPPVRDVVTCTVPSTQGRTL